MAAAQTAAQSLTPPALESAVPDAFDEAMREDLETRETVAVVLRLAISAEGAVTATELVEGAGSPYDEAAQAALMATRFQPARQGDQPVASRVLYRYLFGIPGAEPPPAEPENPSVSASGEGDLEGEGSDTKARAHSRLVEYTQGISTLREYGQIEGVRFLYEGRPALKGVHAELRPGTVTALVGPSGSGKSTLAHLVARLWDVDEGAIRVGGVDVREIPLASLHRHIATVLQDVVLFRETVFENIRLGRPDASGDAVIRAARAAQAHGFIEALPEGYDTVLEEGGEGLSGG